MDSSSNSKMNLRMIASKTFYKLLIYIVYFVHLKQ
jgi:hypothetical protein